MWIKDIGDIDYKNIDLTTFGPYTQPNLDKTTTLPTLGVSPPKGRTLKRLRESPEVPRIPAKRLTVTLPNLRLSPSWLKSNIDPTRWLHESSTPIKSLNKTNPNTPPKTPTPPISNKGVIHKSGIWHVDKQIN